MFHFYMSQNIRFFDETLLEQCVSKETKEKIYNSTCFSTNLTSFISFLLKYKQRDTVHVSTYFMFSFAAISLFFLPQRYQALNLLNLSGALKMYVGRGSLGGNNAAKLWNENPLISKIH